MQNQQVLTKNQKIVLDIIEKSSQPLKAYSILFDVKKKGINAPLQVYRALDKLVEIGKIHKIESRNAFIACKNSKCQITKATVFSVTVHWFKPLFDHSANNKLRLLLAVFKS